MCSQTDLSQRSLTSAHSCTHIENPNIHLRTMSHTCLLPEIYSCWYIHTPIYRHKFTQVLIHMHSFIHNHMLTYLEPRSCVHSCPYFDRRTFIHLSRTLLILIRKNRTGKEKHLWAGLSIRWMSHTGKDILLYNHTRMCTYTITNEHSETLIN